MIERDSRGPAIHATVNVGHRCASAIHATVNVGHRCASVNVHVGLEACTCAHLKGGCQRSMTLPVLIHTPVVSCSRVSGKHYQNHNTRAPWTHTHLPHTVAHKAGAAQANTSNA